MPRPIAKRAHCLAQNAPLRNKNNRNTLSNAHRRIVPLVLKCPRVRLAGHERGLALCRVALLYFEAMGAFSKIRVIKIDNCIKGLQLSFVGAVKVARSALYASWSLTLGLFAQFTVLSAGFFKEFGRLLLTSY